jgi:hypothetical protein
MQILNTRFGSFAGVHYSVPPPSKNKGAVDVVKQRDVAVAFLKEQINAGEHFFLTTNDHSKETLAAMREIGAVTWDDIRVISEVKSLLEAFPSVRPMTGFNDYVGFIEQMLCVHARTFIGSRCSSFSGQILNLRFKVHGELTFTELPAVTPN